MATRKADAEAVPEVRLAVVNGRTMAASWPVYAYRFLFANGDVVNVETAVADSRLSGALLAARGVKDDRIVGSTRLGCVGWT